MGRCPPPIAPGIPHTTMAVAIELGSWFLDSGCAGRKRLTVHCIAIRHVEIELRRRGRPLAARFTKHDVRIADNDVAMADLTPWSAHHVMLRGVERLLAALEQTSRISERQIRSDRMKSLGNWPDYHDCCSLGSQPRRIATVSRTDQQENAHRRAQGSHRQT